MYKIRNHEVLWNENVIFTAPGDIKDHLKHKDKIIIRYQVSDNRISEFSKEIVYQNVLSIDSSGNVLWRLPMLERNFIPTYQPEYLDIGIGNDGSFWTSDGAYGIRFDPETGEILEREFTK